MKKPFLYALSAGIYIVIIVSIVNIVTTALKSQEGTLMIPMTMLSLFVLSAAVMGFLFLSEPLYLLVENRKKEAIVFFAKIVGFFACFVVIFAISILFTANNNENTNNNPVACTEEAKICPDGSVVGRTGPMCEFAACPSINTK